MRKCKHNFNGSLFSCVMGVLVFNSGALQSSFGSDTPNWQIARGKDSMCKTKLQYKRRFFYPSLSLCYSFSLSLSLFFSIFRSLVRVRKELVFFHDSTEALILVPCFFVLFCSQCIVSTRNLSITSHLPTKMSGLQLFSISSRICPKFLSIVPPCCQVLLWVAPRFPSCETHPEILDVGFGTSEACDFCWGQWDSHMHWDAIFSIYVYPIHGHGIFTYMCYKNQPKVGKYTILG